MADDQAKSEDTGEPKPKTTRIGGFEIIELLGKGGMGAVYKARQLSMDRIVALKVLSKRLAQNQAFVARFVREARAAATLRHPNIVQGIDAGQAGGAYYFAMEFVDGCTLKDLVRREGPLDEKRALDIVAGVARALENAHEHGIVHRDIKPDNIMISREGGVKLADLGLARSTERVDTVTIDGAALGTPHYMSPEQARALPDLDTRTDIYSLGATLYHMLTGQRPYPGPTAASIMAKVITRPFPSAKDKNPELSRSVCDLIERMTAKDREQRPQTPAELLAQIRDALEGKVTLRSSRPAARRASAAARRRHPAAQPRRARQERSSPTTVWALAGIGVALLLAVVIWLAVRGSGARERPQPSGADPRAAAKIQATERQNAAAAATRRAAEALRKQLADLDGQVARLIGEDRFGEAVRLVGVFAKDHPGREIAADLTARQRDIRSQARGRFAELARAADAALGQQDHAAARAALAPVKSFGIPELARDAEAKLADIDAREKAARWEEVAGRAAKLAEAGQYAAAVKTLQEAKDLPIEGIAQRIAQRTAAIEAARRAAHDKAIAAYAKRSDEVWALFKERSYAEADKLLAEQAAAPEGKLAAEHLGADLEAAKLLREFWAAVEKALASKKGEIVAIARASGEVVHVKDATVTMRAGRAEYTRHIHQLTTEQAIAYAALGAGPHAKLIQAVVLLADGTRLAAAEEALVAAGDAPGVALYKERLAALRLGGAELAARRAWGQIGRHAKGKLTKARAKSLLAMLDSFVEAHAGSKFYPTVREGVEELRTRAEAAIGRWVKLFDGKTLDGWKAVTAFGGSPRGVRAYAEEGRIVLEGGGGRTGIGCTRRVPTDNYELVMEVMRVSGARLCAVNFPVGKSACTWVLRGAAAWMGLEVLDGQGYRKNASSRQMEFAQGRWYRLRLRVSRARVEGWVDTTQIFDLPRAGHAFAPSSALQAVLPVGVAVLQSTVALRGIAVRPIPGGAAGDKPQKPGGEPKAGK